MGVAICSKGQNALFARHLGAFAGPNTRCSRHQRDDTNDDQNTKEKKNEKKESACAARTPGTAFSLSSVSAMALFRLHSSRPGPGGAARRFRTAPVLF